MGHKSIHGKFAKKETKENMNHHYRRVGQHKRKSYFEKAYKAWKPMKHHAKNRIVNHKNTMIDHKKISRKGRKMVDLKLSTNSGGKHMKLTCHQNCPGQNSKINVRRKKWLFTQRDHVASNFWQKKGKSRPFWHKSLRFSSSKKYRKSKKGHLTKIKCRLPRKLCKIFRNNHAGMNTKNKLSNRKNEHVRKTSQREGISTGKKEHRLFKTMVGNAAENQHQNADKKPNKRTNKSMNLFSNENKGTKWFYHRKADDSPRHIICERSEKIIRKMIYQMNKALRRSMILAKIIGKKFGIDDKTIETLLIKEEDKISSNFINVKKKH